MPVRDSLVAHPARSLLLASGAALVVLAAVTLSREAALPADEPALAIEAREPVTVPVAVREVALEAEVEEPEAVDPLASLESMGEIEDPADFAFVVEIGGMSYVHLGHPADVAADAHRDRAELIHDDDVTSAIAPIPAGELPEELRPWKGRRVLVDGTCAATVVAFAEIGRVSGDSWAANPDEEPPGTGWTVETAFSFGSTMIAGKLDRRCPGSWARAADRPPIALATYVDDTRLERAARDAFLASPHAESFAAGWTEAPQEGDRRDDVAVEAQIVEHPLTGARWAYVHARKPGGCSDHDVNSAATYQISEDGTLTEVETDDFPGDTLAGLIDLNGDGWFERVVVHQDASDRSLVGPTGSSPLAQIDVPFHGCGC